MTVMMTSCMHVHIYAALKQDAAERQQYDPIIFNISVPFTISGSVV